MQTIEIEGPAAASTTVPAVDGRGARHTGRGPGSRNLAASAGAWSARNRRKAIFAWLVLVVAAYLVGALVGQRNLTDAQMGNGQSATALSVFEKAFPYHNGESVLIQARTASPSNETAVPAAVADLVTRLRRLPTVADIQSPFPVTGATISPALRSADGRSVLVSFELAGTSTQAETYVDGPLAATAATAADHPQLVVEEFGSASATKALSSALDGDFAQAEHTSLPITLVILLLAFGALVAAGVPLLLGFTAVIAALGLDRPGQPPVPGRPGDDRAGRRPGGPGRRRRLLDVLPAPQARGAPCRPRRRQRPRPGGRHIGPRRAHLRSHRDDGDGRAAASGQLHLRVVRDRDDARSRRGHGRVGHRAPGGDGLARGPGRAGLRTAHLPPAGVATRRRGTDCSEASCTGPWLSVLLAAGALLALAAPALGMKTVDPGMSSFPQNLAIMKVYDRIQAAFPGAPSPALVVVTSGDVTAPAVRKGVDELMAAVEARHGQMGGPVVETVSPDRTVAVLTVSLAGDGTNQQSSSALRDAQERRHPGHHREGPGHARLRGGDDRRLGRLQPDDGAAPAATSSPSSSVWPSCSSCCLSGRSLSPLLTIVLNLLSVGAAYGLMVLVFQHGFGRSLLGAADVGRRRRLAPSVPPGHPFRPVDGLPRARPQPHQRGARPRLATADAVAKGITSTAGVITSAALVMVAVFSIFATLSVIQFKQLGVALAAAVLIDATVVRIVLLPCAMKLLGEWNWYLPAWLGFIDRRPVRSAPLVGPSLAMSSSRHDEEHQAGPSPDTEPAEPPELAGAR